MFIKMFAKVAAAAVKAATTETVQAAYNKGFSNGTGFGAIVFGVSWFVGIVIGEVAYRVGKK